MKKSYLIMAAIASVALASCSDEQFVGEVDPGTGQGNPTVIRFGSLGKGMTRADLTGADAAEKLDNKFVFAGTKGTEATSYVFDQYTANYVTNTAHSTESNSSNWEYVGQTLATTTTLPSGATQTIKYWDYSTSQYDFAAYSFGKGHDADGNASTTNDITFATATNSAGEKSPIAAGNKSYSLSGTAEQLKACYISDLVTAYNRDGVSDYGNVVTFKFRSLATKIRIALYETVPGYSVGDVLFYADNNTETTPTTTPTLFASSAVLPSGSGTMTVTFPTTGWENSGNASGSTKNTDYNKAHVSFAQKSDVEAASTLTFDALANYATAESKEELATSPAVPTSGFLGRASNAATYAGGLDNGTGKYYTILPYETGANLTLRIKYTLVSTDGSKESITVDNATAVIPAELAKWNPNYAYTYIFKISDMTNGTTGIDQATNKPSYGLTPITLNAVVVDSEDGIQETITTVSDPSITTYTQGQVVTENDEYLSGNTIYVIVNNGTSNVSLTTSGNDVNAKLYTVTVQDGALQTISEESVDNAIKNGTHSGSTYTVKDAAGKELTVTEASGLTASTKIEAEDSPTGNEITVTGAKFTAGEAGTIYAFQYMKTAPAPYTQLEANTYNAGLPNAITASDKAYSFTSYAEDKTTEYGTGIVKVVSKGNGWTTVLVLTNTAANNNVSNADSFVGQEFKVNATELTANTFYQLYTTAGVAQPIYVKVTESTTEQVNNYNATLTGHVTISDNKPAEYAYKIIKIKE